MPWDWYSLLLLGCSESAPPPAKATLVDNHGQQVGEATLTETDQGVKIVMTVENLPPGEHAFHIHAKGACSNPGFHERRRSL